jgi:dolichyl-phosphate-mannose-protein mannosyltransferase
MARRNRKPQPRRSPENTAASVATGTNGAGTLFGETGPTTVSAPQLAAPATAAPGVFAGLEARYGARRLDLALALGFVLLALALYFWRIEAPWNGNRGYIYDEVYHAFTAAQYVNGNADAWIFANHKTPAPEGFAYEWTHPPLGKEIIAVGIWLFGDNPFGWRFTSAIVGAIGVGMIYWLGLVLTRRRVAAILVAILILADGLYFVESRSGLLDIYGAVAMVGAFLAFYAYLAAPATRVRWPLLGLGLGLGLAIATKWNAGYAAMIIGLVVVLRSAYLLARTLTTIRKIPEWPFAVVGIIALVAANVLTRDMSINIRVGLTGLLVLLFGTFIALLWQGNQREASDEERQLSRQGLIQHLIWVPLGMAVLPAAIYMLTYVPFFTAGFTVDQFRELQWQMYNYHATLVAEHAYASKWWQWPLAQRPVWYGVDYRFGEGIVGNTYANGNPLLYWSFFAAVPYALILWWQREKYRQMLVLTIGFFGQWLPWALVPRIAYAYHFLPAAIFGILAVAVTLDDLWYLGERQAETRTPPIWRYVTIGYTLLLVGAFVFFYPIYSNWGMSKPWIDARMWFASWR